MTSSRYRFEPLGTHHDRAAFSCGVEALDLYFHRQVLQDIQRKLAAAFVLFDSESEHVAGYYTLSASSFEPSQVPEDIIRKLPYYRDFPAILIGRLAVAESYQGEGFGRRLLSNALERSLEQSHQIGAMAVIVDAKDDAARRFYERYDFKRFVTDPYRLFLPMQRIVTLVEGP